MKIEKLICGLGTLLIAALWLAPQAIAGEPLPKGWMAGNVTEYEAGIDREVFKEGKAGAYIRSMAARPTSFGTVMQTFSAENYLGKRVRMTAFVKADRIAGWAGLWMRVDGVGEENHALSFDNMQKRPVKGTLPWHQYHIVLDVPENSQTITFGILLSGTGHAWLDEFKFEIVGKNVPVTGRTKPPFPREPLSPGFEQEPGKKDAAQRPKDRR
jgi:hypothetical protein